MKCIVTLLAASAAYGQQSLVTTRTFDINGRPVEGVRTIGTDGSRLITTQNVNGRNVPVRSSEECVVSNAGGVRVIERIVRRYDANGTPGPPERIRVQEQEVSDGSIETATTVWRSDINGSYQVSERSMTVTRGSGPHIQSTTTVERPSLNGFMEVVERREQRLSTSGSETAENETTYRRDANGRLAEVAKRTREAIAGNGSVDETVAEYESASTGQMRLSRQTTARVEPSGTREVTVYHLDPQGRLSPFQQQTIARTETREGAVETTTVRFVLPDGSGNFGPARKAEETVCAGVCGKKP